MKIAAIAGCATRVLALIEAGHPGVVCGPVQWRGWLIVVAVRDDRWLAIGSRDGITLAQAILSELPLPGGDA